MAYDDYSQIWRDVQADRERRKKEAEADAQKRTFNIGKLAPALLATIAAPFTGGASLTLPSMMGTFAANALPSALGEGIRSATGSDTDIAGILDTSWNTLRPTVSSRVDQLGPVTKEGVRAGSDFTGDFGASFQDALVKPETAAEKLIKASGMTPSSGTINGVSYSRPEMTIDAILKQLEKVSGASSINNITSNTNKTTRLYNPDGSGKYADFDNATESKSIAEYRAKGWK